MSIAHVVAACLAGLAVAGLTLAGGPTGPSRPATGPSAALVPTASADPAGYRWPTGGPVPVLRPFDAPAAPWAAGHRGVDLALGSGAPVLAAAAGTVAFAGVLVDRGVVSVRHPDGVRTTYEPVVPAVVVGQAVAAGEVLGHLADAPAHCPVTACLHWGARTGADRYLDPIGLLERPVIRLFPADRAR